MSADLELIRRSVSTSLISSTPQSNNGVYFFIFIAVGICLLFVGTLPTAYKLGKLHSASVAFAQAQRNPNNPAFAAEAAQLLEQAGASSSSDLTILRNLAAAYQLQGRHEDAIRTLETAFRLYPDSILLRIDLARAYSAVGDTQQSAALWGMLGMRTGTALQQIGDTYFHEGLSVEALDVYEAALDLDPHLAANRSFNVRRLLATALAGSSTPADITTLIAAIEPAFMVPVLSDTLMLQGSQFIWASMISEEVTYGTSLAYPYGGSAGTLWWNGRATALIQVTGSNRYTITFTVRNPSATPIHMAFGIDGRSFIQTMLPPSDENAVVVLAADALTPGYHTIDAWLLASDMSNHANQDAIIEMVQLQPGT